MRGGDLFHKLKVLSRQVWKPYLIVLKALVVAASFNFTYSYENRAFPGRNGCIFVTDSLYIKFYSEEIVEDIDAYTTRGVGAFNRCTDTVFFKIPSASFKFANSLMGEHYREQYMEVHKYPYITFKGVLKVKDPRDAPGTYQAYAQGKMTIHGVTREIYVPGTVIVHPNGTFEGKATFWVKPTDYGIKQPSMLGVTAADSVQVTLWFRMVPYTKGSK